MPVYLYLGTNTRTRIKDMDEATKVAFEAVHRELDDIKVLARKAANNNTKILASLITGTLGLVGVIILAFR